jgi:predicted phage terminase large subunit-like protein
MRDIVDNGFDLGFTEDELQALLQNIDQLTEHELVAINKQLEELERRKSQAAKRDDLLEFCKAMQPDYKVGRHHRVLADQLMALEAGAKDRVCVNMPPRHGKSQLVSVYYPAWFLGRNPGKKVMMVSHTTDLAVDFGRKVRNIIASPDFKAIFPDVGLAVDSKSAGRWNTNFGGEYFACGVGSALAGRGADLLLIDDPHSEQDVLNGNFDVFDKAYEWFTYGARTRLMPGGRVAIVQTRWHQDDLTGRVVRDMVENEGADEYQVVELPAILESEDDDGNIVEKALWPEFFDIPALKRTKASMPTFQWNAQYQQNPTSEEASLVKREWWNTWGKDRPPVCEYIISSLDAAAEKHNRADFTALTTWGVFINEDTGASELILLNSVKERLEFPELKQLCLDHWKEWEPDSFIVEKKSAGVAIYQELRRMGIPLQEYTPHRGTGDKIARMNSVADIIASGMVWVPPKRWAEELVEELAAFPFGSHDDLVDSTVMALMRFRQGGFITLPSDEPEDAFNYRRKAAYY